MTTNRLIITTLALIASAVSVFGQTEVPNQQRLTGERKFQILVTNEDKPSVINRFNNDVRSLQTSTRSAAQRGFLDAAMSGYTGLITSSTVNATSSIITMGINYLAQKIKGDRENWYKAAKQQCNYTHLLSSGTSIDDFYALPSTQGAMDPSNLKFEGFGLKNYIELSEEPGRGTGIFYVFCKMRRDSVGIQHIVNHGKFLVELDTLIFVPKYCNLPNDSTGVSRFDFNKRKNLTFNLKVRIYSTWMNQANIFTHDQLLGEFTVHARIDPKKVSSDGCFIFDKNDPDYQRLVSVTGDCFIVPRTFTGTTDAKNYQPTWGTGQYRIEMEVTESCSMNDSYYLVNEPGNKGKRKWDKAKWQPEWKAMKAGSHNAQFGQEVWECIVSSYRGKEWCATLTDPFKTALTTTETTALTDLFSKIK